MTQSFSEADTGKFVHAITKEASHGAVPGVSLEWWYLTGHLWNVDNGTDVCKTLSDGRLPDLATHAPDYGNQFTFFHATQVKEKRAGLLGQTAESVFSTKIHAHSERIELLPLSTLKTPIAKITAKDLDIALASWRLTQLHSGSPLLWNARYTVGDIQYDLVLETTTPPWLHGTQGLTEKTPGHKNFYYSFPFLSARGTRINSLTNKREMLCGSFWFDHEIGVSDAGDSSWSWFAARFPNGEAYMVYKITPRNGKVMFAGEKYLGASKSILKLEDITIEEKDSVCLKSAACYPQTFKVNFRLPQDGNIKSVMVAESMEFSTHFPEQEMSSKTRTYWEGSARVVKKTPGQPDTLGLSYIEIAPAPTSQK